MKRNLLFLIISAFALSGCEQIKIIDYKDDGYTMKELETEMVSVSFYKNIGKEELDLNSGMYASTSGLVYKTDVIEKNSKVSKPEVDPRRVNYEFAGWHKDEIEDSPFDFDSKITSSLILYAHWTQQGIDEEFVEPEYVEPSHIDDSIDTLVSITGVLNMDVLNEKVRLSNAAISRLNRTPNDVTDALNYKIQSGVTLEATFNGTNKISYVASKEGVTNQEGTITVQNVASTLVLDDTNYETKASNYEKRDVDALDHRIMLAGSSSIENWSNSGNDLKPLITYNHGIGGTTVEQWKDKLNQRLVYPYSPKIIVYYVGVNNIINTGTSAAQTSAWLNEMFDDVHAHLPNTHIYYVLINELPNYRNRQIEFDQVNNSVKSYEASHSYVTTLNAGEGLLKANGEPNQAFFLLDGLHMSLAGYAIWGKFIKDKLISDLKNNA